MTERETRDYSPALLAAQQKLERLRQQHRGFTRVPAPDIGDHGRPTPANPAIFPGLQPADDPPAITTPTHQTEAPVVRLYPDIALGMLKQKQASTGRIWLLLKLMDSAGRGWITVEKAKESLTQKQAALRVCGWRQLRKLLVRGEGLFWRRKNDRLWLHSPAKVAAGLGVSRLTGRPIAVPVTVLLQGMGAVRAHFYASFHSGRREETKGRSSSGPISRTTMQTICHVQPRTQRRYEKKARVTHQTNFALIKQPGLRQIQDQAWQRGRALFKFNDQRGRLGQPGQTYLAWQLPNSYHGPHEQQPIGRQKRINRELADLFMKGMTGNDRFSASAGRARFVRPIRRFHGTGGAAAACYNRQADQDVYWRSPIQQGNQVQIWHNLPGKGSA